MRKIAQDGFIDGVTRVDIESGLDQDWETTMQVLEGKLENVEALAFSSDGSKLASVCSKKLVETWDMTTSQVTRRLEYDSTFVWSSVALSPNGTKLALLLLDGTLLVWDISCAKPERFLGFLPILKLFWERHSAVMFSPDGKELACGRHNLLKVFNVDDELVKCDKTVDHEIACICFSHDGEYMFTAGSRLAAWDTANGNVGTSTGSMNSTAQRTFSAQPMELYGAHQILRCKHGVLRLASPSKYQIVKE